VNPPMTVPGPMPGVGMRVVSSIEVIVAEPRASLARRPAASRGGSPCGRTILSERAQLETTQAVARLQAA
jgi:hypothetical protein